MRIRHVALAAVASAFLLTIGATPAAAEPSLDEVREQVEEKGEELEAVIEDYNAAKEELEDSEERYEAVEDDLKPLAEAVEEAQEQIDLIATTSYTGGNLSQINIMLSGTPDETVERLGLISRLGQTQISDIRSFNAATEDLRGQEAELAALIEEQKKLKEDMEEKKDKIEGELDDLKALQDQLEPDNPPGTPPAPSGDAGVAVQFAYDQIGKPYGWGDAGPNSYDCSGLTMAAWAQAGVSLSHNTNMQWNELPHVSRGQLAAGDLVFYNNLNHVAIYAGDDVIVHAPTAGQNVTTADIDSMPIVGYARPS